MNTDIDKAVKVLNQGGIVIFPTDTAFGIGCRIDNEKSVERLFKIRKRPLTQAMPVLVSSVKMAEEYVLGVSEDVKNKLIKPYWPGALTIVLPCKTEKVPKPVRGDGNTLGVRIPDNATALSMLKKVGVGVLGPSANFSGKPTPYYFKDLDSELVGMVDYVVRGKCKLKDVSTVIDCSQKEWRIIREGAVKLNL